MNVVRSTRPGMVARKPGDDRSALFAGVPPVHQLEHPVVDVLKRHVEIRDDLFDSGPGRRTARR